MLAVGISALIMLDDLDRAKGGGGELIAATQAIRERLWLRSSTT